MTQLQKQEHPIVVHAPMTGDVERLAEMSRALPSMTVVEAPKTIAAPTPAVSRAEPATSPTASVASTERVFGLDALRGLLLLAMNFTFTIPPWGPFANWMYHTQVPPSPTRAYVQVSGLTWQDTLFAMFVFTMAAAIPIAMSARLAKGKPYPDVVWVAIRRGFMLLLLAMLIGHVNPYWTDDYTKRGNMLAILGLLVSFAVFVQPPTRWKPEVKRALRYAGAVGSIALLFVVPMLYGQVFSPERRDYIMSALAFCTIAGTLIWLFTRTRPTARIVVFCVVLAGRMAAQHVGWIGSIWYVSPVPWFYQPWYLDLLLIAIPGTFAGEQVGRWIKHGADADAPELWSNARLATLAVLGFSFLPILLIGLYERRYPGETTAFVIATSTMLMFVARAPRSERDRILARLYAWAALLLVVGMFVEPLEGGIKKDPHTLGFLLLMTGIAMAWLASLLVVADVFAGRSRPLRPLAQIGQNALFAYVVFMLGIEHLLWLTGIGHAFTSTWQLATLRSVVLTFLTAAIVWFATKKRLIWKA